MSNRGRIYWPNCKVCQYIKSNPEIRKQLLESTYFDNQGTETLMGVWRRWGMPFSEPTIWSHMRRHTKKAAVVEAVIPLEAIPLELEGEIITGDAHEKALDEIISKGRELVRRGDIRITGSILNTAIKNKADIIKAKKDHNLDAMKMFQGMFDGGTDPSSTPRLEP